MNKSQKETIRLDLEKNRKEYLHQFYKNRYKKPLRIIFQKRKFHAYCIGTPKSGTHSIASLFSNFRCRHEPDADLLIGMNRNQQNGELSEASSRNIFKHRDIFHWLEMESSHLLAPFANEISTIFPKSKFILTVRDCFSWMDSWFNHQLTRPPLLDNNIYQIGRENYYSRGHRYTAHDSFLEEYGLYPIKSYLSFWAEHNKNVLQSIPKNRLLIIKTKNISSSVSQLCNFLEIDETDISNAKSHSFKARDKFNILKRIDKDYLLSTAEEICGALHQQLFHNYSLDSLLSDKEY